jgi:hypothetical protein
MKSATSPVGLTYVPTILSFTLPHADNDDDVDAEAQEEVEDMYGAKYLPPLVRQPLPIGPSVNAKAVFAYRNMQGSSAFMFWR